MITTALIIATYNWPEALELVFKSIEKQTVLPTEILIADDGSKAPTKACIDAFAKKIACKVVHVWHEDTGFKLAEIRNKAIARASADYIIQIDGDIILHPNFVEDHIKAAEKKHFITGSRVLLGEKTSAKALKNNNIRFSIFSADIRNRKNTIRNKVLHQFSIQKTLDPIQITKRIRGCNMSFWKEDLHTVNGYDSTMVGWGREDSEIAARLINNGIACKKIKFTALQYHIYHPIHERSGFNVNETILQNTIKTKKKTCIHGIVTLCEK